MPADAPKIGRRDSKGQLLRPGSRDVTTARYSTQAGAGPDAPRTSYRQLNRAGNTRSEFEIEPSSTPTNWVRAEPFGQATLSRSSGADHMTSQVNRIPV